MILLGTATIIISRLGQLFNNLRPELPLGLLGRMDPGRGEIIDDVVEGREGSVDDAAVVRYPVDRVHGDDRLDRFLEVPEARVQLVVVHVGHEGLDRLQELVRPLDVDLHVLASVDDFSPEGRGHVLDREQVAHLREIDRAHRLQTRVTECATNKVDQVPFKEAERDPVLFSPTV